MIEGIDKIIVRGVISAKKIITGIFPSLTLI